MSVPEWVTAGATVGAAVAGAVAAVAAWRAATASKTIAQQAREHQLDDERRQLSHSAALNILTALSELKTALPHLRLSARPAYPGRRDAEDDAHDLAVYAYEQYDQAVNVSGPLLVDQEVHSRAIALRTLAVHYRSWSEEDLKNVLLRRADVASYADYVKASLVALLSRQPPPVPKPPPHLGRLDDGKVWLAPADDW